MKKKLSKPQKQRQTDSELNSLNSSLGSFGLEPPKRYRQEEDKPVQKPFRQRVSKPEKAVKTLDEKRLEENRRRKNAKVRRKVISCIALVLSIVAVIIVLSLTVLFKIETINISGNKKYSTKEISAVLPIEKGSNLFLCDKDKASEKLEENLPYIYNAEIKRKLPSTIVVTITETPVVYSIKNNDNSFTLLDGKFKVLETSAKSNKNTVSVNKAKLKTAVPGQIAQLSEDKIKSNLLELTSAISRLKLDKVTTIYSTDINNNYLVYDSRITVKLGTLENLDYKIDSSLAAIEKLNESNPQAEGIITLTNDKLYFTER